MSRPPAPAPPRLAGLELVELDRTALQAYVFTAARDWDQLVSPWLPELLDDIGAWRVLAGNDGGF